MSHPCFCCGKPSEHQTHTKQVVCLDWCGDARCRANIRGTTHIRGPEPIVSTPMIIEGHYRRLEREPSAGNTVDMFNELPRDQKLLVLGYAFGRLGGGHTLYEMLLKQVLG